MAALPTRSRSRVPLRTLIDGFEAAHTRFAPVAWQEDADAAFIALFDVVAWAGAIRDWSMGPGRGKRVPGIDGLWFVRNRVLHLGADALSQITIFLSGGFGEAPFGVVPFGADGHTTPTWTWRPSHRLPRGWSTTGKREYESLLAGEPVVDTLQDVSAHLARRRR